MNTCIIALEILTLLLGGLSLLASCLRHARTAWLTLAATWGGGLLLLIANGWLAQAPPLGNMRHVFCFFPLVMPLAACYLARVRGIHLVGYFAGVTVLALAGALSMPLQAGWRQMPALQSPWFAPHVASYVLAYGLLTVAALLTLRSYGRARESALHAADEVVRLAFPLLTFGLWSGALWADAAWGRYWAWDIKEVWSLLTWCLYLLYFHMSGQPTCAGWRRPLLLLGFAAVVVTFLVVNLLPRLVSLHSYAL